MLPKQVVDIEAVCNLVFLGILKTSKSDLSYNSLILGYTLKLSRSTHDYK